MARKLKKYNLGDIYAISGRDFDDIYKRVQPSLKVKKISE